MANERLELPAEFVLPPDGPRRRFDLVIGQLGVVSLDGFVDLTQVQPLSGSLFADDGGQQDGELLASIHPLKLLAARRPARAIGRSVDFVLQKVCESCEVFGRPLG